MKTTSSKRVASSTRGQSFRRFLFSSLAFLLLLVLGTNHASAVVVKVMKNGLGTGRVTATSSPASANQIDCGGVTPDCNGDFAVGTRVTFTAEGTMGPLGTRSVFKRWEGDINSTTNPIEVEITGAFSVHAVFLLDSAAVGTPSIPELASFTPEGISMYLDGNRIVNTAARFIRALPREYKQNWILMTRSESLQTGTAQYPRLLLPSADGRKVFSIGLAEHTSFPGSHPDAIEYMQYDEVEKNFRFHEIILADIPMMGVAFPPRPAITATRRFVEIDDAKCSKCHSTQNVLNRSARPGFAGFPGTTGIPPRIPPNEVVKSKNKPNWDTYDSWAGMLGFNRDRIYKGSVEAAAFRYIFNLWNWRDNDPIRMILEQLELQPPLVSADHRITRTPNGANEGHLNFVFDDGFVTTEPLPVGGMEETGFRPNYQFDRRLPTGAGVELARGGPFITLHHSVIPTSDEGRGVHLFDLLGGQFDGDGDLVLDPTPNAIRIGDEVASHKYATGSHPIDVRPIAYAILKSTYDGIGTGPLRVDWATNTVSSRSTPPILAINFDFFRDRNGLTGAQGVNEVYLDTRERAFSLPRRKADLQRSNLDRKAADGFPGDPIPYRDPYLLRGGAEEMGLIQRYGSETELGEVPTMDILRQEVFRRNNDLPFPARVPELQVTLGDGSRTGIYVDREDESPNLKTVAMCRYFLEPLGVSVDKWSICVRGRSRTYTFADVFDAQLPVIRDAIRQSIIDDPRGPAFNPDIDAELIAAINRTLAVGVLPTATETPRFTDVQRIFNKSCIECHGGLRYPPYNVGGFDLSENEDAALGDRLQRSYLRAVSLINTDLTRVGFIYDRITRTDEACPTGLMPCGGPALSKVDVETIKRWIISAPTAAMPYTYGDPHIKTVGGVSYDFQAAGEFVLLRGDYFEVQTRHAAVATAPLGPNPYTGLKTCVSVNSAMAVMASGHRITYQPNPDAKGNRNNMQLRIDGTLTELTDAGIAFAPSARVVKTSEPGGLRIELPGGTSIVVTTGWWEQFQLTFLFIEVNHARATEGLMGAISPGNWLPALPDGRQLGPIPKSLEARYKVLYDEFGAAWRVNDAISLFDYAPGTSTATFAMNGWPNGESPQSCEVPNGPPASNPMTREAAEQLCTEVGDPEKRELCILDLMASGEAAFARTYVAAYKIGQNVKPTSPKLQSPQDFVVNLDLPISFTWDRSTDADGDPLTYKLLVWSIEDIPNDNEAKIIETEGGWLQSPKGCAFILGLIALLLLIVFFFLLRKKYPKAYAFLALLIVAFAIIAYFLFCRKEQSPTISTTVSNLESGKAYLWKVIVEDKNGATVESDIRRFEVK